MQTATFSFLLALAVVTQTESPNAIPKQELDYQRQVFQQWWGQELVLRLDDLPAEGSVQEFRVPYSGFDYPDRTGGTVAALSKYDEAYNGGRRLAMEHERKDVGAHKDRGRSPESGRRMGLFARLRMARADNTRSWYGHCNGWTAAAIRHAEPVYSVSRNGVVFTPADIKGLLAEIYMYTETEFLGGVDAVIHPAVLHLTLTNWLGRGAHPIGVETAVGEVVINYPIYSYKSSVTRHGDRNAEVKMTVTYAMNTNSEAQRSPRIAKQLYFHYYLDLNDDGDILGGRYYNDSARVDMLWAPLKPIQGGQKGNERGNPYVNVKEVLAIWRASVPEETRNKWLNIDPTEEDRILSEEEKIALAREQEARENAESEAEKPPAPPVAGDGPQTPPAPPAEGERPDEAP